MCKADPLSFRIRARKAARRGETYVPVDKDNLDAIGFDEELGEEGEGFAEYHTTGVPINVSIANEDVDERFRKVMAMEESREREHGAAIKLGTNRGRINGLEVQVEG